jgi:Fe-S-cluster-containing dehydrogenase component
MKEYAILLDSTYCTGCNTCGYKCIQEFRYHEQAARGHFPTFVQINDEGLYDNRCMHCKDPQCVEACPDGALSKSAYGAVLYDAAKCAKSERCKDVKRCVAACPFHAVQYDEKSKAIVKCDFCAHRVSAGNAPVCIDACPNSALQFGEYEVMATEAKKRAAEAKLKIYGLKENGGTHVIVLTKNDPIAVGYPKIKERHTKTNASLGEVSPFLLAAGVVYTGLKKFSERKADVELGEAEGKKK